MHYLTWENIKTANVIEDNKLKKRNDEEGYWTFDFID